MSFVNFRAIRLWGLAFAGCGLLLGLASLSRTQPPAGEKEPPKTSYDQISPALVGLESFQGSEAQREQHRHTRGTLPPASRSHTLIVSLELPVRRRCLVESWIDFSCCSPRRFSPCPAIAKIRRIPVLI